MDKPEAWLRGPVDGIDPMLMPVAHALIQAREDVEALIAKVDTTAVWERPAGAASIGFHVRHLGGALDRLFTYARGEALTDAQRAALKQEGVAGDPPAPLAEVVRETGDIVERALAQLRGLTRAQLLEPRRVGKAGLPSNVLGLLFHAAEHPPATPGRRLRRRRSWALGARLAAGAPLPTPPAASPRAPSAARGSRSGGRARV